MQTINARIKVTREDDPFNAEARCGKCGQLLTMILPATESPEGSTNYRGMFIGRGWERDIDGVLRPTRYHDGQRARAERQLSGGLLTRDERFELRRRLARNEFARPERVRDGVQDILSSPERQDVYQHHATPGHPEILPVNVQCPQGSCRVLNRISLDSGMR